MLCPKMKVPRSTDTTPQASRQHLPSQQRHVNMHVPGASLRQAEHTKKARPAESLIWKKFRASSLTCGDGFLKQQERGDLKTSVVSLPIPVHYSIKAKEMGGGRH